MNNAGVKSPFLAKTHNLLTQPKCNLFCKTHNYFKYTAYKQRSIREREHGIPALSPMESGMKREGSDVLERKEERRWLELMGGSCKRACRYVSRSRLLPATNELSMFRSVLLDGRGGSCRSAAVRRERGTRRERERERGRMYN